MRPASDCGSLNLADAVYRFARALPDAPALVIDDVSYSYRRLAAAAADVAGWLRSAPRVGDGPVRVGILATRSFETYAGMLGAAWAGGTYVPIHPKQPPARIVSIVRQARLSAMIVDQSGAARLGDAGVGAALPPRVLAPSTAAAAEGGAPFTLWSALAGDAHESSAPMAVAADHPAYIMFTSGTTGVPKGVVITAANVASFLSAVRTLYAIHPGDRVGQFGQASFDLSVFEIYAAWDGGASLHVVPESQLMAPAAFIRRQQLTVWTSVPSVISILLRTRLLVPGLFPALRVSFFIGEALPSESAKAWQAAAPNSVVDNHYGPTEAAVACTMQRLTEPPVETAGRGTMAIGKPYPGMAADMLGSDDRFLPTGQSGELALHGPQLAEGYWDDPEQTARRFPVLDHPELGRSRWYRTGDVAYRDADGILHCLGRIDHQVKVNGHRVELEDLEAHLRVASATDAVAAIAWPLVAGGASATGIVAFVCAAAATPDDIRERLRELVPSYMVPRRVLVVDALPLSVNGKVDRGALRAMLDIAP